jgi:hypothetical protein
VGDNTDDIGDEDNDGCFVNIWYDQNINERTETDDESLFEKSVEK